jgi:hypothetical protein
MTITTRRETGRGAGLWRGTALCGRISAVRQPYITNERQDADNILTLCSTETLEASMLDYSTPNSISYSGAFAQPHFYFSHNTLDRAFLMGGA